MPKDAKPFEVSLELAQAVGVVASFPQRNNAAVIRILGGCSLYRLRKALNKDNKLLNRAQFSALVVFIKEHSSEFATAAKTSFINRNMGERVEIIVAFCKEMYDVVEKPTTSTRS